MSEYRMEQRLPENQPLFSFAFSGQRASGMLDPFLSPGVK